MSSAFLTPTTPPKAAPTPLPKAPTPPRIPTTGFTSASKATSHSVSAQISFNPGDLTAIVLPESPRVSSAPATAPTPDPSPESAASEPETPEPTVTAESIPTETPPPVDDPALFINVPSAAEVEATLANEVVEPDAITELDPLANASQTANSPAPPDPVATPETPASAPSNESGGSFQWIWVVTILAVLGIGVIIASNLGGNTPDSTDPTPGTSSEETTP